MRNAPLGDLVPVCTWWTVLAQTQLVVLAQAVWPGWPVAPEPQNCYRTKETNISIKRDGKHEMWEVAAGGTRCTVVLHIFFISIKSTLQNHDKKTQADMVQLVGHELKGHWFDSWSGHAPGLRVRSPGVWRKGKPINVSLSHGYSSCSLSPSLPFFLNQKINK